MAAIQRRKDNLEPSSRSEARLPSLPLEIRLLIFEAAQSFADVQALALAAHIFNECWKEHVGAICCAVSKRSLLCYPEVGLFRHLTPFRQIVHAILPSKRLNRSFIKPESFPASEVLTFMID